MKRITQYQRVLGLRQTVPLAGNDPVDPVLRSLVVHAVFADVVVSQEELKILALLLPELALEDIRNWVEKEASRPLDTAAILRAFPLRSDRYSLLQLVRAMVAIDEHTDPDKVTLVQSLTTILL